MGDPGQMETVQGAAMTGGSRGFRDAMGRLATGVTVVTSLAPDGRPIGCTANAVTSVSLDPPLLLACMKRNSASLPVFQRTGRFGVSVLRVGDEEVARRFSGGRRIDRFRGLELHDASAIPILAGALSWLECRVWNSVDAGDHTILVGEVVAHGIGEAGRPLVFFGGEFGTFTP